MREDAIAELIEAERLPADEYRLVVEAFWQPLAEDLARRADAAGRPLVVGIAGPQGCGKTTLCAFLELLLARQGLRAETLSIDDLYLTRAERERLAQEVHPLFARRGVPGTHAPGLGLAIFEQIRAGNSIELPRFDKQRDDRSRWPELIDGRVDVLLFEGWCVGALAQSDEQLLEPVNAFEREHDPDGLWRSVVNLWLRGDYRKLFDQLDMLVLMAPDDYEAARAMGDAQFAEVDERITRQMLEDLPAVADVIVPINGKRMPSGTMQGAGHTGLAS